MQKSLVDLIRRNIFYLVFKGAAFTSFISSVVTDSFAFFYFAVIGVLPADEPALKIILKMLHQRFPYFLKTKVFWRVRALTI